MNVAAVIGPPASGKSTYLGRLVESHRTARTRIWVPQPHKGIRGVDVGTVEEFRRRQSWPPVARIDSDAERVVQLALDVKDVTVVVDEAEVWAAKSYDATPESALSRVCHRGRHYRVFLVWASQNPWDVHVTLRGFTWTFIFFPLADRHALQWVASTCGQAVADAAARHTGYRPLVWSRDQGLRLSE